jgi:antitoxin YefM
MQTISEAEAQSRLSDLLKELSRNHEPISITRDGETMAVVLSPTDFKAMEESLYILSTSANAERIRQGLADFAAARLQEGNLCD